MNAIVSCACPGDTDRPVAIDLAQALVHAPRTLSGAHYASRFAMPSHNPIARRQAAMGFAHAAR